MFDNFFVVGVDHPRVRGKDVAVFTTSSLSPGSPPRAREGRNMQKVYNAGYGITPACAGRTKINEISGYWY